MTTAYLLAASPVSGDTSPPSNLDLLPSIFQNADILHSIFSHFDHPFHLITSSKVSRLWREVANTNTAWKHLAHTLLPLDANLQCPRVDTLVASFTTGQKAIKTPTEAKSFVSTWFKECCTVCLYRQDPFISEYKSGRTHYEWKNHPYAITSRVSRCPHTYHNYKVRCFCATCHRDVFHARLVATVEATMKSYDLPPDWEWFRNDLWENGASRLADGSYGGWDDTDACSDILDMTDVEVLCS
ncbi:hypothetical protein HK097_003970, partial [Rhizophlyctis rosea]